MKTSLDTFTPVMTLLKIEKQICNSFNTSLLMNYAVKLTTSDYTVMNS